MALKSIYEPATLQELRERINTLSPASQRKWGKMDVAQMLAHTAKGLEVTLGDSTMKPNFMAKIFAPVIKKIIVGEKPFKPNSPTAPDFKINDARDFEKEKVRVMALLTRMSTGGAAAMHNKVHPLIGKLTSQEWSNSQYKHIDHHLRQFGA